ncbi:MAG: cytochrome C oxidase Cbb3 [Alphaproteobacteria bacterium]|nr:cytochrome C oxidase Cbb3 [Alphaproteobacteria bacterium]
MLKVLTFALLVTTGLFAAESAALASDNVIYQKHCASCHGADRLGGSGPALLPENLRRLRKNKADGVIADGRPASQMPAFGKTLTSAEIADLVKLIYTPLKAVPVWGMAEVSASHIEHVAMAALPAKPPFSADPLNLFTVVETGDHHVTILDGDKFEPLARFATRFAVHGGAKYSPDGRFMYLASRDGWVSKYDLYSLQVVSEIRAGINTRNVAVSSDGKFLMVGNTLPHTLVALSAETLRPIKVIDVKDKHGVSSRVSAVYNAPPRNSFVAALRDIPEIWEISYDPKVKIYKGLVHTYNEDNPEGIAEKGPFPVRQIVLDDYLDDFFFDLDYRNLIGAARNAKNGQVVNMNVGRKIADIDLAGMPHLGSGITWNYQGKPVLATPHLKGGQVSVIDMQNWSTVKIIEPKGPGFFMRSHKNTPYAWVDVFFGPNKDLMHIINKRTLEIVKTIRPVPGKTAAHIEFDRDGSHAILSIWDQDGAIIVYDAKTLEEVKRLPMKKPSGKYNVWNKINYAAGTSH